MAFMTLATLTIIIDLSVAGVPLSKLWDPTIPSWSLYSSRKCLHRRISSVGCRHYDRPLSRPFSNFPALEYLNQPAQKNSLLRAHESWSDCHDIERHSKCVYTYPDIRG